MSEIHMDINNCELIRSRTSQVQSALDNGLSSLSMTVDSCLETAWEGTSAEEFKSELQFLSDRLQRQVDFLGTLIQRLEGEIAAGREVDAHLG